MRVCPKEDINCLMQISVSEVVKACESFLYCGDTAFYNLQGKLCAE